MLQYLVYWMHSAFGSSGTWHVPDLRDELVSEHTDSIGSTSAARGSHNTTRPSDAVYTDIGDSIGPSKKRLRSVLTSTDVSSDEFSESNYEDNCEQMGDHSQDSDPKRHVPRRKRQRTSCSDSDPVVSGSSSSSSKTAVADEKEVHMDKDVLKKDLSLSHNITGSLFSESKGDFTMEHECRGGEVDDLGPSDSISQVNYEDVFSGVQCRKQWLLQSLWSKVASGLAFAAETSLRAFLPSPKPVIDDVVGGFAVTPNPAAEDVHVYDDVEYDFSDAASLSSDDD